MTFGKSFKPSCLVCATWHHARQICIFCPEDVTAEFHVAHKAVSECEKKAENSKAAAWIRGKVTNTNTWTVFINEVSWVALLHGYQSKSTSKKNTLRQLGEAGVPGESEGVISPLTKWGYLVYMQMWGLMFPNTSPRFKALLNSWGLITNTNTPVSFLWTEGGFFSSSHPGTKA